MPGPTVGVSLTALRSRTCSNQPLHVVGSPPSTPTPSARTGSPPLCRILQILVTTCLAWAALLSTEYGVCSVCPRCCRIARAWCVSVVLLSLADAALCSAFFPPFLSSFLFLLFCRFASAGAAGSPLSLYYRLRPRCAPGAFVVRSRRRSRRPFLAGGRFAATEVPADCPFRAPTNVLGQRPPRGGAREIVFGGTPGQIVASKFRREFVFSRGRVRNKLWSVRGVSIFRKFSRPNVGSEPDIQTAVIARNPRDNSISVFGSPETRRGRGVARCEGSVPEHAGPPWPCISPCLTLFVLLPRLPV